MYHRKFPLTVTHLYQTLCVRCLHIPHTKRLHSISGHFDSCYVLQQDSFGPLFVLCRFEIRRLRFVQFNLLVHFCFSSGFPESLDFDRDYPTDWEVSARFHQIWFHLKRPRVRYYNDTIEVTMHDYTLIHNFIICHAS